MDNTTVLERLTEHQSGAIIRSEVFRGDLVVLVKREEIANVARFLRDDPQLGYIFLENLCGVDYLGRDPRFEVVYHLLSFANRHRICLKVGVPEDDLTVPTVSELWPTANWQERETYDLLGITFTGHPAMRRILMPDDWLGHPLRKDVPLGEEEIAFTFNQEDVFGHKIFAKE